MYERCSHGEWHVAMGRFPLDKFPNRELGAIGLRFHPLWEAIVAEINTFPLMTRMTVRHEVNELDQFFVGHEFQEPIAVADRVRDLGNKLLGWGLFAFQLLDLVEELMLHLEGFAFVNHQEILFQLPFVIPTPLVTNRWPWTGRSLVNFRSRHVYQFPSRWELPLDNMFPNST